VVDECAAGAEDDQGVGVLSPHSTWELVEEVGERSLEYPCEDRITRKLRCGRSPADLVPRGKPRANVDLSARHPRATKRCSEVGHEALPGERPRPVDGENACTPSGELSRGLRVAAYRLSARDRVPRVRVIAQERRSSASAALHEKSPLPSGFPVDGW
jgi:hypothetical protein